MEEVRKKCEALKRRPRRTFLLLVRVCGPLVTTTNLFQCKWGTLFARLGVCKCVLFALKEGLEHEQGVQKCDGPQKNKKRILSPTHKLVQKSVFFGYAKFQVPEHLHRLAEKLRRVKVMCERNVRARACVCVCVLLRCVNKIVHLNGFA